MNEFMGSQTSDSSGVEFSDTASSVAPNEVVLGRVLTCDIATQPVVRFQIGNQVFERAAITTQALSSDARGRQVALMFVGGSVGQPIVLGVVRNPLDDAIESFQLAEGDSIEMLEETAEPLAAEVLRVDGQRVHVEGKEEVVLKCGSASITLTKSGKIVLRGKYLVSRSSGVNRILGGSVQVN